MIFRAQVTLFSLLLAAAPVRAQFGPPAGGASAGSRAVQLSVGGTSPGNVQGSLPSGETVTEQALPMSLSEAIQRGLKYNLSAVASANAQREANAARMSARAQMRPDFSGDLREAAQQTNLAAAGLNFSSLPTVPGVTGFSFPSIVGPYHYFDVRASVTQSVADMTRLHNYRQSKESVRGAAFAAQDSRELIVLTVTEAYLKGLAWQSRIETARAQIVTAQTAYTQAVDRNKNGLNARIDVNRSQLELQTQQQRLNALLNELAKDKIALARLIGLPQAQAISLTDKWPFETKDTLPAVNEMVTLAWSQRPDIQAAQTRVAAAEEARRAAGSEYLPTVSVSADYGVIGVNPNQSHGTFGVTASLHVPIYRSGRIEADVEQASAGLAQRRAELQDMRGKAEQDVRIALLDVDTATAQMRLAESSRRLAADTVEQAWDRFRAGVADTVEMVQAQESLTAAEQDYISAMHTYQLARVGLARATGAAVKSIH